MGKTTLLLICQHISKLVLLSKEKLIASLWYIQTRTRSCLDCVPSQTLSPQCSPLPGVLSFPPYRALGCLGHNEDVFAWAEVCYHSEQQVSLKVSTLCLISSCT